MVLMRCVQLRAGMKRYRVVWPMAQELAELCCSAQERWQRKRAAVERNC